MRISFITSLSAHDNNNIEHDFLQNLCNDCHHFLMIQNAYAMNDAVSS